MWKWNFFAKFDNFFVYDLTLLVDHCELVLMDFKYKASVFIAIVEHQILGFEAMSCATMPTEY